MDILQFLDKAKTQYQAVEQIKQLALQNGFVQLNESNAFNVIKGGKYFVIRDGSAIILFTVNDLTNYQYKIVASHTDSPCFKVKLNGEVIVKNVTKLNVEKYGGGLLYTYFDRPLKLCGRLCGEKNGKIVSTLYESKENYVIPSLAIHFNRKANEGLTINPQNDCMPIFNISQNANGLKEKLEKAFDGQLIDYDLYLVSDQKPFYNGENDCFISAPRIDNLSSCLSSFNALNKSDNKYGVNVCYLADNEEVGSRTKQGAGSKFLYDTLKRINSALNFNKEDFYMALSNSFMVSCDNAHALHPNNAQLSDQSNNVLLGEGLVIKHHANQNYTTDGYSSCIFKSILKKSKIKYQDFFMRSDLACGGTLGAISSSQLSIRSIDIGMGQLAMHSACETFASCDYQNMVDGLTAFYNSLIICEDYQTSQVK